MYVSSVFGCKSIGVKDVLSRFSRGAKAAVAGVLAWGLALSGTSGAQAGYFKTTLSATKTCNGDSALQPDSQPVPLVNGLHISSWIYGSPGVTVFSKVKVKATLTWQPNTSLVSDPAPSTVNVNVGLTVNCQAKADGGESYGSLSLSNGYDDAWNTPVSGLSLSSARHVIWPSRGYVMGAHLLTVPVSGGVATVPEQTLSGSILVHSGAVAISTRYTVSVDNRSVKLSRVGATGEEYKPEDGQWVTYGHSRYSHREATPVLSEVPFSYIYNWQDFNANYSGFWSTIASPWWWWNPGGDGNTLGPLGNRADTFFFMTKKMAVGTPFIQDGAWLGGSTPSAPPLEFTYTAQDRADNAKVTAKYKLQLHDEWENLRRGALSKDQDIDKEFPPGPSADNFWISRKNGDKQSMNGQVSTTIVAGDEIQYGFSAGFGWPSGWNLGFSGLKTFTESREFSIGSSADVPEGKKRYPLVAIHYYKKHYLVDKYATQGRVKNTSRADGSWEQWIGDSSSVELQNTWSIPIPIDDYSYSQ